MKLKDNKNIVCTVSAGYSSIMMAVKIKEWYPDHNIIYVMANTSKEHPESLKFMHECDKHFNLNIVWLEAIFYERGKGVGYKLVTYSDLKRDGEVFEQGIKKLGIPCKINKWCNRDLKMVPIRKYANSIFGRNNYSIAVGMRADELDRVGKAYESNNTFYPLMDNGITTKDRNKFWHYQPIKIGIPAYKGNCDICFEKSLRKNITVISEDFNVAIWWDYMEQEYSTLPIDGKDSYNAYAENGGMYFYRENTSTAQLVDMANQSFKKATDEYVYENDLFDAEGECGSGCQVFN